MLNLPEDFLTDFPIIKVLSIAIALIVLAITGYYGVHLYLSTSSEYTSPLADVTNTDNPTDAQDFEGILLKDTPTALVTGKDEKKALASSKDPRDPADISQDFNILILGIDRRYSSQKNWRTDVIQLLTISANRKKGVVTHIPRDVWTGAYKINAVYNLQGPDKMKDFVQEITGQRPDRIIRVDFDAFVWAVDSVGGIEVDVPNGFTDNWYPDDRSGSDDVITVTFDKGPQEMDGERALIYARSRKGSNGEGSDYARGVRQQIVMKSVVKAFFTRDNVFNPKTAETLYNIATQKVYTDLSLKDTKVLFEVLKNYGDISLSQLSLDTTNYLESGYVGKAWTLKPINGDYTPIHNAISTKLQ